MAAVTGDVILRDLADIVEEGIECCEDGIVERSLEDKLSRLRSSEPLADDDPTPSAFSRLSSFFFAGVPICVDPSNSTGSSGITSMARKLTSYFAASRPVLADDPTVITTPNNKPPRRKKLFSILAILAVIAAIVALAAAAGLAVRSKRNNSSESSPEIQSALLNTTGISLGGSTTATGGSLANYPTPSPTTIPPAGTPGSNDFDLVVQRSSTPEVVDDDEPW